MADKDDKLDIEVNGKKNNSNNTSGSDLEIKSINSSGKDIRKTDKNKLEIDIETDLPINEMEADVAAAALALDTQTEDLKPLQQDKNKNAEDLDKNTSPELPQTESKEPDSAIQKDSPQEIKQPTPLQKLPSNPDTNQSKNNQPPAEESQAAPQDQSITPEQTSPTTPPVNQDEPNKTPPTINNQPHEYSTTNSPKAANDNKPIDNQTTDADQTSSPDKTPPKISQDQINNVGPHTKQTTPPTVPDANQNQTKNDLNSTQAQNKPGIKDRIKNAPKNIGGGLKNKAQQGLQTLKDAPKNTINNIRNNFSSDHALKQKLEKRLEKIKTELSSIGTKLNGIRASNSMRVIKFFFPGLYSKIFNFSNFSTKLKGEAKLKALQVALTTGKGLINSLKLARTTAVIIEAHRKFFTWLSVTLETAIVPIILLIFYPILIILLIFQISVSKLGAPLVNAINEIIQKVNEVLKELENALKIAKKEVRLMREATQINNLMASSKQDRKEYLNNSETSDKNSNIDKQSAAPETTDNNTAPDDFSGFPPAANDNTESDNLQQAA